MPEEGDSESSFSPKSPEDCEDGLNVRKMFSYF